jgi:hypothetical protein
MANEIIAKAYEMLAALAVDHAFSDHYDVFREKSLDNVSMRTDVIVTHKNKPEYAFLVTHSGSETDYQKKFARDSTELVELFINCPELKGIYLLIFDSHILPSLLGIASITYSGVFNFSEGISFLSISNLARSRQFQEAASNFDIAESVREQRSLFTKDVLAETDSLGKLVRKRIDSKASKADTFLPVARRYVLSRAKDSVLNEAPHCTSTRFRRGLSKLLLFNQMEREGIYTNREIVGDHEWAVRLGLVRRVLSRRPNMKRFRICDDEITGDGVHLGPLNSMSTVSIEHCLSQASSTSALYVRRLRNADYLDAASKFICKNWKVLTTPDGMEQQLRCVSQNPSQLKLNAKCYSEISWHWLYTYLVALFKADSGKKQGFGASVIARLSGERKFRMQNSVLGRLEYSPQIFPSELYKPLSNALSIRLSEVSTSRIEAIHEQVVNQQLRNELEDKLMCNAINPLPSLIEHQLNIAGISFDRFRIKQCCARAADASKNAGVSNVIKVGDVIIWWRTAHYRANVSHKRKELQNYVLNWRISWTGAKFAISDIRKTILVVDGDFESSDLQLLRSYGWDHFIYPHELAQLPCLIG